MRFIGKRGPRALKIRARAHIAPIEQQRPKFFRIYDARETFIFPRTTAPRKRVIEFVSEYISMHAP